VAEELSGVNGEIIRWARERYNMTPEDAAQCIGVDCSKYIGWENGDSFPTYAKLKKISEVFKKPTAIFFFPTPPKLPSITGDLRTLPDAVTQNFSKNILIQFEKAKVYQMNLSELYLDAPRLSILSEKNQFPTDLIDLCDYFRLRLDFPIAAQKARKNDKIVFEIYRERFYELGIYVFKDSFKDNSASGLCIYDEQYPVIVINNSMSFARQNFTLFHELYHLISQTNGVEIIRDDFFSQLSSEQETIEKRCDVFANEFLIPSSDFEIELKKKELDEDRISELSKLYSVSKEAIMYKLYKMRIITSSEYSDLKEVFYGDAIRNKKNGDQKPGGSYYNTHLSYLGSRYTGDVFHQYFSGKIDTIRASEMLSTKADHLPKLETYFFRGMK
jgi:Zn-dependent peptidase ImmA (M78 family)/DNA-binding XRE family transcriptional regulator